MIKNFFLFKEAIGSNNPKIQKLVDEANILLKKVYDKLGEGANIDSEHVAFQVDPITYINGVITIEYGTGFNYKKDREKEVYSLEYDSEKEIISSLKSWIKLFKKNVFNNSEEGRNKFFNKIKVLSEELDVLFKIGYDKYGIRISIYDTQSTWQEEYIYKDIIHDYGKRLILIYSTNSTNRKKEYDLQKSSTSELEEIISELEDLIKQYKKFLRKEGIIPLTPNDFNNLNKFMTELTNLSNTTNYINLETTNNNHYTYFVEDNLDEDLKKYNTIPGVYMEQSGNYIKIHITLTKVFFLIHEQYLPRIYKLYKSIKN